MSSDNDTDYDRSERVYDRHRSKRRRMDSADSSGNGIESDNISGGDMSAIHGTPPMRITGNAFNLETMPDLEDFDQNQTTTNSNAMKCEPVVVDNENMNDLRRLQWLENQRLFDVESL